MAKLTKESCISQYRKLKKDKKSYNTRITRQVFLLETGITKTQIDTLFGTYGQFVDEAEDVFREKLPESEKALLSEKQKKFDKEVSKQACIEDLRRVQEANPTKFISRNFYRIHGNYSDSTWDRYFGTMEEFRSQAGIQLTRQQRLAEKGIAKHASVDHYREFFKSEVLPYFNKHQKTFKPEKIKTIMVGSDIHDEEADMFTLSMFIHTCKLKQPDYIVLNGDIFDLYEFSRYSQDPRMVKIKERFDFVHKNIFEPLRKACPNAQIDFILGNHEIRLLKLIADKTPNLRVLLSDVMGLSFADIFGVDKYQINLVSKLDLGTFSRKDMENEKKQNFRVYYGCYAITHEPDSRLKQSMSGTNGHHHQATMESHANYNQGSTTWVQTPAMHWPNAEYLQNLSGWNMGFLEVIINTELKQVIQKVHSTFEGWTVIDGVYYEAKEQI